MRGKRRESDPKKMRTERRQSRKVGRWLLLSRWRGRKSANASSPSPDVHWEVWWGRKAVEFTTAADTLWCQSWSLTSQRSSPCFCAKVPKERFAKVSSNTPRPHTPCRLKFTLRALKQVTVLHFVLRLSFYQTHDFFRNISYVQSLIRQRFFCFVIFLAHEILQNPIVLGRKMKNFPGAQPPDPFLLQTPHKHPHQLRHCTHILTHTHTNKLH